MSTDGHLNSFYFLSIMNNVGTIIMYKFLYEHTFSIHLGIYLKVVLLDYIVTMCLSFEELWYCFPKWLHHCIIFIIIIIIIIFFLRLVSSMRGSIV